MKQGQIAGDRRNPVLCPPVSVTRRSWGTAGDEKGDENEGDAGGREKGTVKKHWEHRQCIKLKGMAKTEWADPSRKATIPAG